MTIDNKKVAIITGASEGIGAALSLELLQNNFKVIGISSNKKKLKILKINYLILTPASKCIVQM